MQLARHMILWQVSDKETTFMKTTEVTSVGNKKTPLYTKFQKACGLISMRIQLNVENHIYIVLS
jgi:hypothetical protein